MQAAACHTDFLQRFSACDVSISCSLSIVVAAANKFAILFGAPDAPRSASCCTVSIVALFDKDSAKSTYFSKEQSFTVSPLSHSATLVLEASSAGVSFANAARRSLG